MHFLSCLQGTQKNSKWLGHVSCTFFASILTNMICTYAHVLRGHTTGKSVQTGSANNLELQQLFNVDQDFWNHVHYLVVLDERLRAILNKLIKQMIVDIFVNEEDCHERIFHETNCWIDECLLVSNASITTPILQKELMINSLIGTFPEPIIEAHTLRKWKSCFENAFARRECSDEESAQLSVLFETKNKDNCILEFGLRQVDELIRENTFKVMRNAFATYLCGSKHIQSFPPLRKSPFQDGKSEVMNLIRLFNDDRKHKGRPTSITETSQLICALYASNNCDQTHSITHIISEKCWKSGLSYFKSLSHFRTLQNDSTILSLLHNNDDDVSGDEKKKLEDRERISQFVFGIEELVDFECFVLSNICGRLSSQSVHLSLMVEKYFELFDLNAHNVSQNDTWMECDVILP